MSDVLLSALNPFAQSRTTTCSTQENACFQTADPTILNNPTGTPTVNDYCSQYLGVSCTSIAVVGVVGVLGLLLLLRK